MNIVRASLLAALCALAAVGCASTGTELTGQTDYLDGISVGTPPAPKPFKGAMEDTFSYWEDDGTGGPPRIKLDLSEQAAYFYRGNHLVGQSLISSGTEGRRTPSGMFRVVSKDADHVSSRYGWMLDADGNVVNNDADILKDRVPSGGRFDPSKMTWYLQFAPAIGMHAGYLPGYPASHGCVRMPEWMAKHFFDNAQIGTPVQVVP